MKLFNLEVLGEPVAFVVIWLIKHISSSFSHFLFFVSVSSGFTPPFSLSLSLSLSLSFLYHSFFFSLFGSRPEPGVESMEFGHLLDGVAWSSRVEASILCTIKEWLSALSFVLLSLLTSYVTYEVKKNRPYNYWLKKHGHYLLCFCTSFCRSQFGSLKAWVYKTMLQLKSYYQDTPPPPPSRNKNIPMARSVPFCQMTQHNLPATEKKVTKGLMNKKVLRRRVRMF